MKNVAVKSATIAPMSFDPNIEFKRITVREFVKKCKPFRDQFVKGNSALVNIARVSFLKERVYQALSGLYGGMITLIRGDRIAVGNHRWAACCELMEAGLISPEFSFYVKYLDTDNPQQASKIAYLDNHGGNRANKYTHKVESACSISVKVFKPIFTALEKLDCFTKGEAQKNAVFLGAYLNNNLNEAKQVMLKRPLQVTGAEIYDSRGYAEADDHTWFDTHAKIDLRDHVDSLVGLLESAADIIKFLKKSEDWMQHVAGGRSALSANVIYILLAASLRGVIKEKAKAKGIVTVRRIGNALRDPNDVKSVSQLVKDFNRKPALCENSLLEYLT